MASGRLLSKSALAKRLISGFNPSVIPHRNLHGIPSASPLARELVGSTASSKLLVPRRHLHLNEHSFHELAVDYGFTEFEPLYKVLRFIVIYRFIAEVFL